MMKSNTAIKPKNTKAITKLRIAQGFDVEKKACHYCLDSHKCHICQGKGMIPTWDSLAGKFKAYGGRVACWNCEGLGGCPHCTEPPKEAA